MGLQVRSLASLRYRLWPLHISAGKDCECWSFSNILHVLLRRALTPPASGWENRPVLPSLVHPCVPRLCKHGCLYWVSNLETSGTAVVASCYLQVSNCLRFISFLYSFWYKFPLEEGTRTDHWYQQDQDFIHHLWHHTVPLTHIHPEAHRTMAQNRANCHPETCGANCPC